MKPLKTHSLPIAVMPKYSAYNDLYSLPNVQCQRQSDTSFNAVFHGSTANMGYWLGSARSSYISRACMMHGIAAGAVAVSPSQKVTTS
jgi:hypothetical protein